MRFIFLGAPGVGKGTQVKRLSREYAIPSIATGDMFRGAIAKNTPIGLEVKSYLESGRLVPDEVTIRMVQERLCEEDAKGGYILDGFPRTIKQAKALSDIVKQSNNKIDRVFYFDLEKEEIKRRVLGRRNCPACQQVYHLTYDPPKKDGVCDCGATLVQRKDDQPETLDTRLSVYQKETTPLIDYYERQNLLTRIDASGTVDEVCEKVRCGGMQALSP